MHPIACMEPIQEPQHTKPTDARTRFLQAIASHAQLPAHVSPATAAAVAVCTLATRLTRGQAHQVLAALPSPIQPLFQACIAHRAGRVAELDDAGFLRRIADRIDVSPAHAELICSSVFRALRAELSGEVVQHVASQLPRDLSDLWTGTRALAAVASVVTNARHELLAEIADRAPLPIEITAGEAFSAVMCNFSQRLSGGEARDVLLGLPEAVRPLIERCVTHRDEEGAVFDRDGLMNSVADELGTTPSIAEQIVVGVFAAVKQVLPAREVHDVASQLPPDLRDLWITA